MSVTQLLRLESDARAIGGFPLATDADSVRAAESLWVAIRVEHGFRPTPARLITAPESQHKVGVNVTPTWSLALSAGRESGLCVNDAACAAVCVVNTGGKGAVPSVQRARAARTDFLLRHPEAFLTLLARDVLWFHRTRGSANGRPNANSDVAWEVVCPQLFALIASLGGYAYDYTKRRDRVGHHLDYAYRVTYSATAATSERTVRAITERGDTVTMVLPIAKGQALPAHWRGIPVVDGDASDDRYLDQDGAIVGLRAKAGLRGVTSHPLLSLAA